MMIATVFRGKNGVIRGFQISGHAEYDEPGKDIVCAAVSALAFTCVNAVEQLTGDETDVLAANEEEGFLYFRLKSVSEASSLLFDSLVLGLNGIRESYGSYLTIQFQEV